jgi:site-specific recombinase XerD
MDFDEALQRHVRALKAEGLSQATQKNHAAELRLFKRCLEARQQDWRTLNFDEFAAHLAEFGSNHSVPRLRNHRIVLTKFYGRAVRCGWVAASPAMPPPNHTAQGIVGYHRHKEVNGGLTQAIEAFGQDLLRKGHSELTAENYGRLLQQWGRYLPSIKKCWNEATLQDLLLFLRKYRLSRIGRPPKNGRYSGQRSNSTVALMATCLRSFYGWAARMGYMARSPAADIEPTKRDRPLPRGLKSQVVRQLLDKLNNPPTELSDEDRDEWLRNRMVVLVLLFTGIRLSECAAARWDNLDEQQRWLHILRKGNKEAMVPIHPYLMRELLAYQQHCGGKKSGPIFISRRGGALTDEGISEMFRRFIAGRLGIACTPHQLRHTFASTLLNEGAPVEQIQPAMGHEDVRTTMIYARVADERLQQLVRLLPLEWCGGINGGSPPTSGQQEQPNEGESNNSGLSWLALLMLMSLRE